MILGARNGGLGGMFGCMLILLLDYQIISKLIILGESARRKISLGKPQKRGKECIGGSRNHGVYPASIRGGVGRVCKPDRCAEGRIGFDQ